VRIAAAAACPTTNAVHTLGQLLYTLVASAGIMGSKELQRGVPGFVSFSSSDSAMAR
jgi:hypothetical protein